MSVFLKKNLDNKADKSGDEIDDVELEKNNPIIEYYKEHFDKIEPVPLYKNTKFLTLEKINGGLLTESEKRSITESPTGYNFNVKNSGYFIVDVDVCGCFDRDALYDIDFSDGYRKQIKLLNPKMLDPHDEINFPDKIQITEFLVNGKRKKLETKNLANIFFSTLFRTPYVLTPSKGFHFYFKNDLDDEKIKKIFGHSSSRYIKCMSCFHNLIDIDIFLDNKKDDAFLVLPFSKVIIENEKYKVDQENNFKLINVSYSGIRYSEVDGEQCDFRNASEILKWLEKYVDKREIKPNVVSEKQYTDRGRVVSVDEMNKIKYTKWIIKDFAILSDECKENISTYASKPFNLYQLMSFVAFFPIDMHLDILKGFMKHLGKKLSDNAKDQLLNYYYHLAKDDNKLQDLKHPRYFEAILNSTYEYDIENKYVFIHEKDNKQNENEDEVVIEDESLLEREKKLKEIINVMAKLFKDLKIPSM